MATRKTSTKKIGPIAVIAIALKQVKTKADYDRIATANTNSDFQAAWTTLSAEDQERIRLLCGVESQPDINAIAQEIINCGSYLELQAIKADYGETMVKQAWLTIPVPERQRITAFCKNGHHPTQQPTQEPQPVTEQPKWNGAYTQEQAQLEPKPKTRSLFSISDDLEKLNELLDECADDTEQQQLINDWLEHLGDERDKKLDAYAALISEMQARAEVRKTEAKRMMELATADENRAKLLKDRLKCFFEAHNLKTVDTARYRLSLALNGGKPPLVIDQSVMVSCIPERFQKVSVDFDKEAIRDALERGERLTFAQLGERGTSMRIK